jgi:DNA polymerase III gamma/tau subunit
MSDSTSLLASALQRLGTAIDLLDAASARRQGADRASAARATELELMRGDRAKLAELLDQALARGRSLEAMTQDIAGRVDRAISLVKDALDSQAPDKPAAESEA